MAGTVNELLDEAQVYLDNFEKTHNLKSPYLPDECYKILELNYEEINNLSVEMCGEYALMLEQYGFYLQRIINKEHAILQWLNNKLEQLVCDKLNNYDQYARYEIKIKLIAKENNVVAGLSQQINLTKQKIARLEFIPTSIKAIAKSLNDIRQTKLAIIRGEKWG